MDESPEALIERMRLESLAAVIERLQRTKRHWTTVARMSSVPYGTLTLIAEGKVPRPHIDTLQKIEAGVTEFERLRNKLYNAARAEYEREEFDRLKKLIEARRQKPKRAARAAEGEGSAA